MKILVNVSYEDNSGRFWADSCIKKRIVQFDAEKQNIHKLIRDLCMDQDCMQLTYKAKPMGNVFQDQPDGQAKIVGYIYRGKTEIYTREMSGPKTGFFDVWVTLQQVVDLEIEEIDNY